MKIEYLELPAKDLKAQQKYYAEVLELPAEMSSAKLTVRVGQTTLVFTQAEDDFDGAYHFAFDIPENKFAESKVWSASRQSLLQDLDGSDEFSSENWNSHSLYFKDAAGNVLEFIARHNLGNAETGSFDAGQLLHVSEIGLPSENVIQWAGELCSKLGISVFKQEAKETFTPVGDDRGLLILPVKDRIWIPNSGVPAKLLPVKVGVDVDGRKWGIRGYPYEITAG